MAPVKEEKRTVQLSLEDEKWLAKALNAEEVLDIDISSMKVKATDLMLKSLGYCFGITIQAYTNHKGYKIQNLKIEVIGEKHPSENRYEKLTINVSFDSDLTPEQIERVMEIGKRGCTVGNTLEKGAIVEKKFVG
jgi:uncharacterized OsmC-like protein